jgi:hypothetical protein
MSIALRLAFPLSAILAAQAPMAPADATTPNAVVHLFNGKDLAGWKADVPERDNDRNLPAT